MTNIIFPLCLKPTTNVSIPNHTRYTSAFLLPDTVNDRGPRYANFALLRLQDSLHSPFRKYKIWYLVHGSTVSCIFKRGENPSPRVIIILNYNMATKYTRSKKA